jgi:hypothetical protein
MEMAGLKRDYHVAAVPPAKDKVQQKVHRNVQINMNYRVKGLSIVDPGVSN